MIEPINFNAVVANMDSAAHRNMVRNLEWVVNTYLFEQGLLREYPDRPEQERI